MVGEQVVSAAEGGPVEGLRLLGALPYGGVWVLEQLWRELGIDSVIKKVARGKSAAARERALFAMVANRALEPYSKLYCWEQWLREEVYLPSAANLSLSRLYRAMDFVETTSRHFEVDDEDGAEMHKYGHQYPAQGKRGHSKNGRTDAPQIVVGLAITRDGLPPLRQAGPGRGARRWAAVRCPAGAGDRRSNRSRKRSRDRFGTGSRGNYSGKAASPTGFEPVLQP